MGTCLPGSILVRPESIVTKPFSRTFAFTWLMKALIVGKCFKKLSISRSASWGDTLSEAESAVLPCPYKIPSARGMVISESVSLPFRKKQSKDARTGTRMGPFKFLLELRRCRRGVLQKFSGLLTGDALHRLPLLVSNFVDPLVHPVACKHAENVSIRRS